MLLLNLALPRASLIPCQVEGKAFCVVVTANNIIVSLIPVISVNIIVMQGLTCVQLHNFAFTQ